jgi:hypothetical protein
MNSSITVNPIIETRTEIIQILEEDAKNGIGDDQSPTLTQLKCLTTVGVNYHDHTK